MKLTSKIVLTLSTIGMTTSIARVHAWKIAKTSRERVDERGYATH